MKGYSIVNRLTLWFSLSLFLIVAVATSYLYWSNNRAMTSEERAIIQDRLQAVQALLQGPEPIQSVRRRVQTEWASRHFERQYVRISDSEGKTLVESPGMPDEVLLEVFSAADATKDSSESLPNISRVNTLSGGEYLTVRHRMALGPSEGPLYIRIALDLENERKILATYRGKLLAVLILSFIVAILVGRSLAIAGFRPVRRIVETARRVGSSNLDQRIPEADLPIELLVLGKTVNQMLGRLEESFSRLSRFTSDIAHELRTPINNIRGETEVALNRSRTSEEYRQALESSLEEADRLGKIIDSLLFLAKAENTATALNREAIDIGRELEKIIEFYEPAALEMEIDLKLRIPAGLKIEVDRTLFQRAIANLLSNSLNYTTRGGHIEIAAEPAGRYVTISVRDTGEGISAEDLPKVFDRFYRADEARRTTKLGGFGLGLTIVKSIVQLHGGDIVIESERERGTTVRLKFLA